MQPLGNKILVKDIVEEKKSASGLILDTVKTHYKKVEIIAVSPDSQAKVQVGDVCLANRGGVELEQGIWLCNETLLDCKL
jgi:co-chaperonin GroES (HSP10)